MSPTAPIQGQTDKCDKRTHRACTEWMSIQALLNGYYRVHTASGRSYDVSIRNDHPDHCPCPDCQKRGPDRGCKHIRRVRLDIACGELPHPDEIPNDEELAAREPERPTLSATAIADGGQPTDSSRAVCRDIHQRIRELRWEIKQYEAEIKDLETALSVIEDVNGISNQQ